METISTKAARRLALIRAGLLKPEWSGLPHRAAGCGKRARDAALSIIRNFGYLQLDTVSIAGARSHAIVLMSRLEGFDPQLGEDLLKPGESLFEYWGHEASWLPIELYPLFAFRRRAFASHPWWGNLIAEHPQVAETLRRRIRDEGPLRSIDMDGRRSSGWWDLKIAPKVAAAMWSSGELAIRERKAFQRTFDLAERVIPTRWRLERVGEDEALEKLLLLALGGHGWATTGTLVQTWRLSPHRPAVKAALSRLAENAAILPCSVRAEDGSTTPGWIRPSDLELATRVNGLRPRRDRGVLLSPFDPLLWDRQRVQQLFGFHQVLEIYKPAPQRIYGYYCLPVLAGDRLIARFDLKADRKAGKLNVLSEVFESDGAVRSAANRAAAQHALERFGAALDLSPQRERS
ncbi:MAG: crosslink repair DNA glycosylase YcaQ family protein [Acidobacteriota bacterium]